MKSLENRFKDIIKRFSEKHILVIGDLMMDAYYWGEAKRISPEAPVPIIDVNRTNFNPGGAGNVALNFAKLGSKVSLLAVVGNDENGTILLNQLQDVDVDISSILILDEYQTPIKTRVIAQEQQVVRIDQENSKIESNSILSKFSITLENSITKFDGVVLTDYNKGLLSKDIIRVILKICNENSVPVYVDPKLDNFFEYKNVRLFKPNSLEFQNAVGNKYSDEDFKTHGILLRKKLNAELILITRGGDNSLLFTEDRNQYISTESSGVHDVSGAGDTVISIFALADLCGATPNEAANLANFAAGIVCSQVGVVPITTKDLLKSLKY